MGEGQPSSEEVSFDTGDPFENMLEVQVPNVPLDVVLEDILADEWSEQSLLTGSFKAQGATEIQASPWTAAAAGSHSKANGVTSQPSKVVERSVNMRMPLPPAPFCPKTTRITKTFRCSYWKDGNSKSIMIQSSSASHDVPFGSHFLVQD